MSRTKAEILTSTEATPEQSGAEAPGPPVKRLRRRMVVSLVVLAVLVAGIVGVDLTSKTGAPPLAKAPHFSLPRLGGGAGIAYPSAGLTGHPVVLVMFASWCTPCQAELPRVAKLSAQLQANSPSLRVVGIDGNDASGAGMAFARKAGFTDPVASDQNEAVASDLGLRGLPDTVFINASGKVARVVQGVVSNAQLRHWAKVIQTS
ncbi:MAG: Redoxin domain protein [Acidimicrobiaceae bacterium]|nr:Redoxin domain protein [Acidimicrobiaceae bacterium]